MHRFFSFAGALLLSSGLSVPCRSIPREAHRTFKPAGLVSAADVRYPVDSIAIGTVVLEVAVSDTGKVEGLVPIRNIQSLTEAAIDSVKNWHFKAASLDGKPVRSRTVVAVTFNTAAIPTANIPLPPLSPSAGKSAALQPQPVRLVAAAFAQYPVNSVSVGTIVLRVAIDKRGTVNHTLAVRSIAPLTSQAILALKEWRFTPAEFEGKPLPSSIGIAFVFQPLPKHR